MRIAHLLIVHRSPDQVAQLIPLLSSDKCDIYIHLDKKADAAAFASLGSLPNVFFIKNNIKVYWAAYSLVKSVLISFEEILKNQYDYINIISGQDLPIKSISQFTSFLEANKGKEFITCNAIGTEWPEAAIRLKKYDLPGVHIKGKYQMVSLLNAVLPAKKFPFDYTMVGGSNWLTITTEAAKYILHMMQQNPKLVRYCKLTWASDEIIFSTLLYNSSFKENIMPNLLYVDWQNRHDGHPKILCMEDLEKLKKSDKFFARKFDKQVDAAVMEEVIKMVQPH